MDTVKALCMWTWISPHLSHQHLIDEDPQSPPVHCSGVGCIRQDLRGQKLRGPTEGAGPVTVTHSYTQRQKGEIVAEPF